MSQVGWNRGSRKLNFSFILLVFVVYFPMSIGVQYSIKLGWPWWGRNYEGHGIYLLNFSNKIKK